MRILICEDKPGNGRLIKELAIKAGFESASVYLAPTIDQAWALYETHKGDSVRPISVITMDGLMPEKFSQPATSSTSPLVRRIKQSGFTGIFIASSLDKNKMDELIELGCTHSCPKPIDEDRLLQILRQAIASAT